MAFGFDLSDISFKIMQLKKSGKGFEVVSYTDYQLPRGIMVNDIIMDQNALADHIIRGMAKMDFGKLDTNKAIASIPESKAFVRVITLPKMSEEEAGRAVPFEAEQYIPIPLDQTYLDWQIVGEHEDKMDVLVTASPKEYIDSMLLALKKTGIQPVAFEVESAACSRALISPDKNQKDIMLVDMNTYRTSLIVIENGNLQFTSSVPIAGDAFTQSIAKALSIPADQAEKIKREVGLDDSKEHQNIKQALVPVVDGLISEIRNILKFHAEHSSKPITQIILCGGTSKLLHLTSYMYEKLIDYDQIDIILGNPWLNVFDPRIQNTTPPVSREDSLSYTTSIGLAIRGAQE